LPIDALKLDMALTKPTLEGDGEESMIRLIIDIAQYLQVPVVAEGVETEEQYRLIKELGCGFAQGYFFSKPIPKEDFDYYLEEGRHLS
ncbi:MAG: EAL domain-containing protein, partial [Blautia sp.]|nr:EAL domain-containing protein [Blautia sp.]